MDCKIDTIVLNESKTSSDKFRGVVSALCNKELVIEKGGFLFSAVIIDNTFHIGILPYFAEGQRSYHYNINLPSEEHVLTGFINSNSTIDVFVKLDKEDMDEGVDEDLLLYLKESYTTFARLFLEHGFSEDISFGPLTPAVFMELNLFSPIPRNMKELADIQI